jgi:amino acid adenylation domain-containing protein
MEQNAKERTPSELAARFAALSPARRQLLQHKIKERGLKAAFLEQIIPRRMTQESPMPLSFSQERLWFLDQLEPGNSAYNMSGAYRVPGRLDVPALEQSLNEIVCRHEVLRTTFKSVDGVPRQVIADQLILPLPVIDLSEGSQNTREETARRCAAEAARQPFDLSQGPLIRATLLRMGEEEHIFLLSMHHIISDGWSMPIFFRELSVLYHAYVNGKASPLPELPIQYADYAIWQRHWLQGEVLETQLSYWRKQLENISPLSLATDRPRPRVQTFRGACESLALSEDLTRALKDLSRKQGASLYMTLLAAMQILLHRLTGQDDIAVGSPIAGRNRAEIEDLIGFFLNTLVLRTKLSDESTFFHVLEQVRGTCLEAYAHQDLPFEKLLEELRPERDLSRTPLFQVFFNMVNVAERARPAGLNFEPLGNSEVESKFDLTSYVREHNGRVLLNWVYNADLFDQARIREMLSQYETLLRQISEHPDSHIHMYSLLTAAGRAVLPNPVEPLSSDWVGSVHDKLAQQARSIPDQVAITDADGSWTYATLNARSNQLANYLLASGIQREEIVAVYAHRSASLPWVLLGILKAGAAFLILDPAYPTQRLVQYVRAAQPRGLIKLRAAGDLSDELGNVFPGTMRCRVVLPRPSELTGGNFLEEYSTTHPDIQIQRDDLAYIAYTSGSTGEPNGILGTHGPLSHFLHWQVERFALGSSDRFTFLSGVSHDPALRDMFTPLWSGGTLCVPDSEQVGSPGYLRHWIEQEQITVAHLAPAMIHLLNERSSDSAARAKNNLSPSSLRYGFFGGDSLSRPDLTTFQNLFPAATCVNFYGATETPQAMGYFVIPRERGNDLGNEMARQRIPLGRGIEGAQLLVLNDAEQLAGIGELGEIYVRTPYLARGYLGNNALTQQRFIINPFNDLPGDRLYKTGDKGRYLSDGSLEFIGRSDYQVKIRGFRIELGEIETVLSQNPGVRQAVVLAREDSPGEKRLVAYVASSQEQPPTGNDLREFLKKRLPDPMVPSAFVNVETLPLTPNGKVNRSELPAPDCTRQERENELVAPRDELELQLTRIWERVLKIRSIGVTDNFFELGGHSLLAVRLFGQIEKIMGMNLPIAALFHAPTVEQLARLISQDGWRVQWRSLVAVQPGGTKPPFFCVHAHDGGVLFWRDLARHLGPDQPFYSFQPQGLDGSQPPYTRIEDMAAHYIKDLRALQPEGPYFIGGHCFGGLVAFEMAQQLHALGAKIAFLALFDCYAPRPEKSGRSSLMRRYRYRAIRFFERTVSLHVGNLSVLPRKERFPYLKGKFNKALYKLYMAVGAWWIPAARNRRLILKTGSRASRKYYPKLYPGKVTLFRATELGGGIDHDPEMGWGRLAGAGVEIHLIPGYHAHIVLEPRVRLLAKELIRSLSEAQDIQGRERDFARRPKPIKESASVGKR